MKYNYMFLTKPYKMSKLAKTHQKQHSCMFDANYNDISFR